MEHFIDRTETVNRWNRDYPPKLTVQPGDTVRIRMRDASDGQVMPGMTAEEFAKIDKTRIHSLTGPIAIERAEEGDTLIIDILDYEHEGWAWTSIIPGMGLLNEDFEKDYLHHWKLEAEYTDSMPGVRLPLRPFCGIMGVQRSESGEFRTRPPGQFGGNMDVKHLCAGSRLMLPVAVPGAGFCAGDAHATQGDGEVSINGMEAPMSVTVRFELEKRGSLKGPQLLVGTPLHSKESNESQWHVFIESNEDIRVAAQNVVRRAIDYLTQRLRLSPEQAYVLCSVVLDLKLSQMVNVPVTTVSGYLPESIFI